MRLASLGDRGPDAALPMQPPVPVVVVAAVGEECVGRLCGRPTIPAAAGILSNSGSSCVTSLRLPPVSDTACGMPWPSMMRWCLLAGLGSVLGPCERPGRGSPRSGGPISRAVIASCKAQHPSARGHQGAYSNAEFSAGIHSVGWYRLTVEAHRHRPGITFPPG